MDQIRVEKTSRNVIIHTGHLSGFDPDFLLVEAGEIHAKVKTILHQDRAKAAI